MGVRYVVTGAEGQLGRCLLRELASRQSRGDTLVAAYGHADLDIADEKAVDDTFARLSAAPDGPPDVCVNAAAYNAVDACESSGADSARRVNGEGPGRLATACEKVGARLVHVSSDYVFPGEASTPIPEDAEPGPKSAYGRSKLEGERRVLSVSPESLVVRTSWVFGPGRNFVGAILRQGRLRRTGEARGPLDVVDDQIGCPTYAADLAAGIVRLVAATRGQSGEGGLYHLSNSWADTPPSWWDFARAVLDLGGYADLEIRRGRTADLNVAAPRPAYSVLDCRRARALGIELRTWREALGAYFASSDLALTLELTDPEHAILPAQGVAR